MTQCIQRSGKKKGKAINAEAGPGEGNSKLLEKKEQENKREKKNKFQELWPDNSTSWFYQKN